MDDVQNFHENFRTEKCHELNQETTELYFFLHRLNEVTFFTVSKQTISLYCFFDVGKLALRVVAGVLVEFLVVETHLGGWLIWLLTELAMRIFQDLKVKSSDFVFFFFLTYSDYFWIFKVKLRGKTCHADLEKWTRFILSNCI